MSGKYMITFTTFTGYALGCLILTIQLFNAPLNAPSIKIETNTITPLPLAPKPDFAQITDIDEKKSTFFSYLLPMIKHENTRIAWERRSLVLMKKDLDNDKKLSSAQKIQLKRLSTEYDLELTADETENVVDELLLRVDQIPPAMVLAQSANESAWGTSRFAQVGNNFFGQWCFSEGCGLVPLQQRAGTYYEVATFKSVNDSVNAYFHNINTNNAYKGVREQRAALRKNGEPVTAAKLIPGLTGYSERGEAYIHELQSIISVNDLTQYKIPVVSEG